MIKIKNIEVGYNNESILNKCSFNIPEGKITLIKGESGCGKTSLLYRIGLVSEDKNFEYLIQDININKLSEDERSLYRKQYFSFVFQDNMIFDDYTILGNLKLASLFNNKSYSEETYKEILKIVNINLPLNQSIDTLSGGEKQRLAIACAICKNTQIIILDEPTSFLDNENGVILLEILKLLSEKYHKTIIISSHDQKATKYANVIYEIKENQLVNIKSSKDSKQVIKIDMNNDLFLENRYFINHLNIHKIRNIIMTFILIMILLLTNIGIIYVNNMYDKAMNSSYKYPRKEMFITSNKKNKYITDNNETFKFNEKLNGMKIYSYQTTYINIENNYFIVVPLFNNDISLTYKISNTPIYLSSNTFQELETNHINIEEVKANLIVNKTDSGYEDTKKYSIGGVIKNNVKCPYVEKQSTSYVYVDYRYLKELYNKANVSSYNGITLITNDYEAYKSAYKKIVKTNYGINAFFTDFNMIDNMIQMNTIVRNIAYIGIIVFSIILTVLIEIKNMKRRNKEFMQLKVNGINNYRITKLSYLDIILDILIGMIFIVMFIIIKQIKNLYIINTIFLVSLLISLLIIQIHNIKQLSCEKILRN